MKINKSQTIKQMQERMQHIADILTFNPKTPDFFKLSSERNSLSVQIEVLRQQSANANKSIQAMEVVSINQYIINK